MNGTWAYDDQADVWHLVWQWSDDQSHFMTWCGKDYPVLVEQKPGVRLTMNDVLHDECVRKSEEL